MCSEGGYPPSSHPKCNANPSGRDLTGISKIPIPPSEIQPATWAQFARNWTSGGPAASRRREDLLRPGPEGWRDDDGRPFLNFSTNDYLRAVPASRNHGRRLRAALEYGVPAPPDWSRAPGRSMSRMRSRRSPGSRGYPAARVFEQRHDGRHRVIPALFDGSCEVFADRLSHACLLDGCLLSGARLRRFHHNDAEHLGQLLANAGPDSRKLVVTSESVFSMDSDIAPLCGHRLRDRRRRGRSHGGRSPRHGSLGSRRGRVRLRARPAGAGLPLDGDVQQGPRFTRDSSAAAGCTPTWFIHAARTCIFTTAPAPAVAGASLAAVRLLQRGPGLGRAVGKADPARLRLTELGFHIQASAPRSFRSMSATMRSGPAHRPVSPVRGIPRPRHPAADRARAPLRLGVCLDHSQEVLDRLVTALCSAFAECGVER
ncbi:MAG: aminotransferase class I/II-fold pyridoxal phosphate-dependent enzyme [Kiritimatiellia bacterium]